MMGLSEDGEENTEQRFEELCLDLNLDTNAKEEAWQCFERIRTNYTLEGDSIHWLACALYVACRMTVVPTVNRRGVVEGNCVSLTRLLGSAKLSLLQFFNKMKKWADMANLPQDFREKVDRLERNFAVSTVIFKKYQPIFLDIFGDPANDPPRQQRSRKQRRLPCSLTEVFQFAWTMFVQVKGNFPAISDDLVNSYHLLLCCIDWFYANAIQSNRKDLLNPQFSGLPENYHSKDYKPGPDVPCIIQLLCDKHEGLVLEAKGIKEHWWKPYLKKLFDKKILKGKAENYTGILELNNFDSNSKAISHAYEEYVLKFGDFDERIFLSDEASQEIGTPAKPPSVAATGELAEKMQVKRDLRTHFETRPLAPSTPLTGRRYLKEKEAPITPVSTATQSVSRLQALLSGLKTCPSENLDEIFSQCARNPREDIMKLIKEMGEQFCTMYAQPSDDHPGSHIDFAKKRLQLGESLYFKALENVVTYEISVKRQVTKDHKVDLTNLLEQDIFHRSLFACCLEIVIFSYNSQRTFPWIVDVFEVSSYHFYKVIELLIRAEDGLSRDVVKHLNHIEELILESLAWKAESPLWDAFKQLDGNIPTCEEVTLPNHIDKDASSVTTAVPPRIVGSPLQHPALRRLAEVRPAVQPKPDHLQSPTGPSAADRFSSPAPGSAKRRLFPSGLGGATASPSGKTDDSSSGSTSATSVLKSPSKYILQQAQTQDGRQVFIQVPLQPVLGTVTTTAMSSTDASAASTSAAEAAAAGSQAGAKSATCQNKPKKTGSLALFLRKLYHLASVRVRELCERLDIDTELRSQIWTCFEHCLVRHSELMMDRHLDQIIMCSVYVMCKVTGKDRSFQDIMKCYRLQPQAQSHVYRSVLLTSRRRRTSGSSDSSRNGASGSSSPVPVPDKDAGRDRDKKRTERLSMIRSTSTLPVPRPNSQPPTPTRLAGTGSSFEFEDRGDLIKFYNMVFVKKIQTFALKFSAQSQEKGNEAPPLSPLPMVRPHAASPRRVSNNHSLYISPHKNLRDMPTPQRMLYCFNRSPSKELHAINNMIRLGHERNAFTAGKRLLGGDENDTESTTAKKICYESPSKTLKHRLAGVMADREEANGGR